MAIAKYHRAGGLNNKLRKSKVRVPADSRSGEGSLGMNMEKRERGHSFYSCKASNPIGFGSFAYEPHLTLIIP